MRITDSELEVMKLLWEKGDAVSTAELVKILQGEKGWERATVRTLIRRLLEKGAVVQEKREVLCYRPAIAEEDYKKEETKGFIDKLFGGNAKGLVAALVDEKAVSPEELAELAAMFYGKGGGKG